MTSAQERTILGLIIRREALGFEMASYEDLNVEMRHSVITAYALQADDLIQ